MVLFFHMNSYKLQQFTNGPIMYPYYMWPINITSLQYKYAAQYGYVIVLFAFFSFYSCSSLKHMKKKKVFDSVGLGIHLQRYHVGIFQMYKNTTLLLQKHRKREINLGTIHSCHTSTLNIL